jgi:hypothetical protein
MQIEVDPPLEDGDLRALERVLRSAGIGVDVVPSAYTSAWQRTARREALDNEPQRARAKQTKLDALSAEHARGEARVVEP